ncbi:MAG TPA: hypothetical protein VF746_31840 [Longimicrobium sp.]
MYARTPDSRPAEVQPRPGPPLASAPGPRVLLAAADADAHAVYGPFLEHAGYALVHASSAGECVLLAQSQRLAAAVVSVGRHGLLPWSRYSELARAADEELAIICLTTDPRVADADRLPPRALAVLMLPCEPPELVAELGRVLQARGRRPN